MKRKERLTRLGFRSYREYLGSPHWAGVEEMYRQSSRDKLCLSCGGPDYQVRHVCYDRLGGECLDDVLPLCRPCYLRLVLHARRNRMSTTRSKVILQQMNGWTPAEAEKRFATYYKRPYNWRKVRDQTERERVRGKRVRPSGDVDRDGSLPPSSG